MFPDTLMVLNVIRWLYTLFLAIDANFRLRRKHISSEDKDPAISQGFGYFVKTGPYVRNLPMKSKTYEVLIHLSLRSNCPYTQISSAQRMCFT